jgi:flagellar assembly factor FliW
MKSVVGALYHVEESLKIQTTRFGELQVNNDDVILFKEGILGFDKLTKFFVVDPGDNTLILWLQSAENGAIAFPMIEPKIFKPDYIVKLIPNEMTSLELESLNGALIYSILTIPKNISEMSANLKAPIVINNKAKIARQIVLQDNKLDVKFEMYKELKKYIVTFSSDDSRRNSQNVSTKINEIQNSNNSDQPKKPNRKSEVTAD